MRALLLLLGLLALASMNSGCASAAVAENMVPGDVALSGERRGSVAVAVQGGRETNPMWTSEISDEAFAEAVEGAIRAHGPFASVEPGADLLLELFLLDVDQPVIGLDFEVAMKVRWTLVRPATNELLREEVVESRFTAGVGDAFVGVTRLRLANEGAARENIRLALPTVAGWVASEPPPSP